MTVRRSPYVRHSTGVRHRAALTAVTALAAVLLAGCATGPDDNKPQKATEPLSTPTTQPTEPTEPTATPEAEALPLPDQQLHAGTVANGRPTSLTGEGSAVVGFTRDGEIAVVVTMDCSACEGTVTVTQEGRGTPWGTGDAPLTGSYLVDIFKDTAPEQSLIVHAEGPWTVTLSSWNDLPPVSGQQQGTGSTVLLLGDTARAIEVTYAPATAAGDRFSGRAFSAVEVDEYGNPTSVLFGSDEPFTETYELTLPGILAISTHGTWTVTPIP